MFEFTLHNPSVWLKSMVPMFPFTLNDLFEGLEGILKWIN
jgi:hypothetical protein